MTQRGLIISGLLLILLAALAIWWFRTFERVPEEITLPPRGEARYNSLFALKKTLEAQHIETMSYAGLNLPKMKLQPGDVLIITADVRTLTLDQVTELMKWVTDGGHLIFSLPSSAEGRVGELLDYLGLSITKHYSCMQWGADKSDTFEDIVKRIFTLNPDHPISDTNSYCTKYRFRVDSDEDVGFDWLWGSEENGYMLGRQLWGKGSIFVAANLNFLTNSYLNDPSQAALTWQVLVLALGKGKAHLVYAIDVPPWYVLLVYHGWPILLPLLLALFAWLWMRSQRFGPLLPLATAHRRALLEHVQATGEFAFRRGRVHALYAAAWRSFQNRLQRRDPSMAALDGEALVQALATRHQLAVSTVRQALSPLDLIRPDNFLNAIKTLIHMRSKL